MVTWSILKASRPWIGRQPESKRCLPVSNEHKYPPLLPGWSCVRLIGTLVVSGSAVMKQPQRHSLWYLIQPLLHGVEDTLVLPTLDPALLARGARCLHGTALALRG